MPFSQGDEVVQPFAVPSPFTAALDMDHPNPQPKARELNMSILETTERLAEQNGSRAEHQPENQTMVNTGNQNQNQTNITANNCGNQILLCGGTEIFFKGF
mmetsp:Transcript_20566/g.26750  ORF Transcript_20566/g.26750 Transcript_20566/m.26750 type:complete len:101 (-) Transcript_20566:169-471(-)